MDGASNRHGHSFRDFTISGAAHAHLGDHYTLVQGESLKWYGQDRYAILYAIHPFGGLFMATLACPRDTILQSLACVRRALRPGVLIRRRSEVVETLTAPFCNRKPA